MMNSKPLVGVVATIRLARFRRLLTMSPVQHEHEETLVFARVFD
jgi:hypothetical protein